MKKYFIAIATVIAVIGLSFAPSTTRYVSGHDAANAGDPPTGDPLLPQWWILDNPTALNYGYTQMAKCSLTEADFIRARFRIPLGPNEPDIEDIKDPQWGDIRLHTAWAYTHQPFTQHIDVTGGTLRPVEGWDIMWELDIPIDFATDQQNQTFTHSSVRIVNAWVDFAPWKDVRRVQIPVWNCMKGTPVNTGIDRGNLPQTPPF